MFANVPRDLGSVPGRVIPKTLKMVLDTSLLNTQHYKVRIEGKVEQSRERSSALPLHLGVVAIEKGAFWSPLSTVNISPKVNVVAGLEIELAYSDFTDQHFSHCTTDGSYLMDQSFLFAPSQWRTPTEHQIINKTINKKRSLYPK